MTNNKVLYFNRCLSLIHDLIRTNSVFVWQIYSEWWQATDSRLNPFDAYCCHMDTAILWETGLNRHL